MPLPRAMTPTPLQARCSTPLARTRPPSMTLYLIGFVGSDTGKQVFGEDGAAKMLAHSEERKKAGAKFCDCAACRPCHELLHKFGREEADVYL